MTKSVTLVQSASKGGYKYISTELAGDTVSRSWGLVGGRSQKTSNTYGAKIVGKANEKSPEQAVRYGCGCCGNEDEG